jgi:hypothetical protein
VEISLIFAAFSAKIGAVKDKFVRLSTGAKKAAPNSETAFFESALGRCD